MPERAADRKPKSDAATAKQVTHAMEDYLKAIYRIEERDMAVTTQLLATELSVTGASVTNMTKRLDELKLVEYSRYKGVTLTEPGRKIALEVIRHHRLLELYLSETFGMPWHEVHAEAERLEHHVSAELEARIASALGHPTHDPHGDPIPTAELVMDDGATRSLDSLEPGAAGRFVRVSDSDPDMLRYLEERGISLGDRFEVVDRQPFEGPLTVRFGRVDHVLGGALARAMRVEPDA